MLAGFCFLLFGPIEIAISFLVHNSAIAANASHDAFDGLYFIAFGYVDVRLARSRNHKVYCTRRGLIGMATAFLAIVFVGFGLVFERSNDTSLEQMLAGLIVGPFSFYLNYFWERRLHEKGEIAHKGFEVHLLGDMAGSAIVTLSGVIAFITLKPSWNLWGGIAILIITMVIALTKSRSIWQDIRHTAEEHPHYDAQHAHHHH